MSNRITPFRERLKRKKKKLVVFICTGNTCRSPMAAMYMRHLLKEHEIQDIDVRSAGVMTIAGLLASPEAMQVMEAHGVDMRRHRSAPLTPELLRKADLVLAMSPFHMQTALRMCEDARDKTKLLKEFTRSDLKNVQIADPMGCTLEVFKKTFKEIKAACDLLIKHDYITGGDEAEEMAEEAPAPSKRKTARKAPAAKGAEKKAAAKSPKKAPKKAAKKVAKKAVKKVAKKTAKKTATKKAATKKSSKK